MPKPPERPKPDPDELIEERKGDHVDLAATRDVESAGRAGWSDVRLIHEALPELDFDRVDLGVDFLGRRLRAPLAIAGMTGGHPAGERINAVLARAAERHGLAMGLGSQRAALRRPHLARTYAVARHEAPSAFLIANVGAPQLIAQGESPALRVDDVCTAIEMVGADALAVHLNFLQEAVQPEGDRHAVGSAEAIRELVQRVRVPVVAKETGAGLTRASAERLRDLGVAAIDVGGQGGTSFAAIEGLRAEARRSDPHRRLGQVLRDWGVPTAVGVVGAAPTGLPLIATGGIRSGLDAARALALGATLVGVARPLLQAALEGDDAVDRWIEQFLRELRTVLFLTGSPRPEDLRSRPRVILGETRAWLEQLAYLPRTED